MVDKTAKEEKRSEEQMLNKKFYDQERAKSRVNICESQELEVRYLSSQ